MIAGQNIWAQKCQTRDENPGFTVTNTRGYAAANRDTMFLFFNLLI